MSSRVQTIEPGMRCDDSSTETCSPTSGARVTIAITPPAERFLTLISCSLPFASVNLPTRSIAERRSSDRRSAGRGTALDKETVVDSKAASLLLMRPPPNFLRISSANMLELASEGADRAKLGLYRRYG